MANLFFLGIEECVTIVMGEFPRGVYATDRADNPDTDLRSYSSSEIRTVAQIYANLYSNLEDIWENKFISLVQPDEIGNWEVDLFGSPQDASLPFLTRQQNLLTKYRATGGLSYPYINNLISSILTPLGLSFLLAPYCGMPAGAWRLDVTPLDEETYLAEEDPINGAIVGMYDLDCNAQILTIGTTVNTSHIISAIPAAIVANIEVGAGVTGSGIQAGSLVVSKGSTSVTLNLPATGNNTAEQILIQNYIAAGLTQAEFQSIQTTAYTYAVYIYGNADAQTISTLESTLTAFEPAGSTYEIFNNAVPPIDPEVLDLGGGTECVLVDSYDCGYGLMGATFNVWDFSI